MQRVRLVLLVTALMVAIGNCETDFEKIKRCVAEAEAETLADDHCGTSISQGDIDTFKLCCGYNPALVQTDVDAKTKAFTDSFTAKVGGTGCCTVRVTHSKDLTSVTFCIICTDVDANEDGENTAKPFEWIWGKSNFFN